MNNTMITIPYADAIEYGENTSALFKALWELTDLIRLESNLKKHHRAYLHVREDIDEKVKEPLFELIKRWLHPIIGGLLLNVIVALLNQIWLPMV